MATEDEIVDNVLSGKERFYAPIEVARMFGLKQATVQELCRNKKFPNAVKRGTMWAIPGSDIKDYIKNSIATGGKS